MTTNQKVDILYRIARGESVSRDEKQEVKKYKVDSYSGEFLATKKNLRAYVSAVDSGKTHSNFYSWCANNGLADARRKGGSKKQMTSWAKGQGASSTILGGALALMQIVGSEGVAGAFILGCIIAFVINKVARDRAALFNMLIPLLITAFLVAR